MHRIVIGLILVLVLAMGLVGCGKSDEERWQEQYDLGVRYLDDGNYEEAIIAFNAAIEIDPKKAGSYVNRAAAYYAQDNIDAAVADYTTALDLDPSMADVYCAMADIYAEQGHPDLAQQILQQGIDACGEDETLLAKVTELGYVVEDGEVTKARTERHTFAHSRVPEVPQAWIDFHNDIGWEDYYNYYESLPSDVEAYLLEYIDLALNSDEAPDMSRLIDADFLNGVMNIPGVSSYSWFWSQMADGAIIELWIEIGKDSETRRCELTYSPQNGDGFIWRYNYFSETWHYGDYARARTTDGVFDGDYTTWHSGWYDTMSGEQHSKTTGTLSMGWKNGVETVVDWDDSGWSSTNTITYENGKKISSSYGEDVSQYDSRASLLTSY